MKQKRDRYEMHKYWGKKPSNDLKALIDEYSNDGDTVFDPFSGYGVFCCEAYIMNRNVISNDLNPVASFLNKQLLERSINLELLEQQWKKIRAKFEPFVERWYKWTMDGNSVQLINILRDKNNIPLKAKYKLSGERRYREIELNKSDVEKYLEYESSQIIEDWYPETELIQNSRISAKDKMKVSDLFTKRTLACHARLLWLINTYSSGAEKNLLKVAFTANLANCSKLVPPIKSRGDMAPGAWMTGFYIGRTYLENNVLTYFDNRFSKVIKGKRDYLNQFNTQGELDFGQNKYNNVYKILQYDAKQLKIESGTIDYIFTDPPYGDAVPYFEQSILWNSWLKLKPDYENEIVISDSKERKKNHEQFEKDIEAAFSEIRRVLKPNKYLSLTYHSLSGLEWKVITNACIKNGFRLVDYKWLVQKSFTPRQINRLKSIKGDVLVTLQRIEQPQKINMESDIEVSKLFVKYIEEWLSVEQLETNEIFLRIMKIVFSKNILIGDVNLLQLLIDNFEFAQNQKWKLHGQIK